MRCAKVHTGNGGFLQFAHMLFAHFSRLHEPKANSWNMAGLQFGRSIE
jgi:hypothetical protein